MALNGFTHDISEEDLLHYQNNIHKYITRYNKNGKAELFPLYDLYVIIGLYSIISRDIMKNMQIKDLTRINKLDVTNLVSKEICNRFSIYQNKKKEYNQNSKSNKKLFHSPNWTEGAKVISKKASTRRYNEYAVHEVKRLTYTGAWVQRIPKGAVVIFQTALDYLSSDDIISNIVINDIMPLLCIDCINSSLDNLQKRSEVDCLGLLLAKHWDRLSITKPLVLKPSKKKALEHHWLNMTADSLRDYMRSTEIFQKCIQTHLGATKSVAEYEE